MTSASEPWQHTAVELTTAYRARRFTPVDAIESALAHLEYVNPRCNAVVTVDAKGARDAAAESTRRWLDGAPLGPLDGVPITIKDNILVRGMRSTWGSKLYADFVPDDDELPVARLRKAGAILIGKTNVPEFTLHGYTDNALFGPTRNPWNLELTPGGSSGGAVAAVACGIGPIALATDGGGSIRRPCAHTGLIGFKPSRGAVPRAGGFPRILHDFEVIGPIARTVEDIAVAMSVIGDERNWSGVWTQPEGQAEHRILFVPSFGSAPVDPAIAEAVEAVARELARQGHVVTTAVNFDLAAKMEDIWPVVGSVGLARLVMQRDRASQLIGPLAREIVSRGAAYTAVDYNSALEAIDELDQAFAGLFTDVDMLLTPTTAAMPWGATQTHPTEIAGREVGPRGHAIFTPFANAIGLPAISLPCPAAGGRMPIGFQLCAARGRDLDLLRLAASYMAVTGQSCEWPNFV